jgi:hypothetical protein
VGELVGDGGRVVTEPVVVVVVVGDGTPPGMGPVGFGDVGVVVVLDRVVVGVWTCRTAGGAAEDGGGVG